MSAVRTGCRWGGLFGGDRYAVLHFIHHQDGQGPDVLISDIVPFITTAMPNGLGLDPPSFDSHLPLWSALLYMLLSTPESDGALIDGIFPSVSRPEAIPEASESQEQETLDTIHTWPMVCVSQFPVSRLSSSAKESKPNCDEGADTRLPPLHTLSSLHIFGPPGQE